MSTGVNSSGNNQAIINIAPDGGLVTAALADALKSSLKIEFPTSEASSGVTDILTSTALAQIISQLSSNADFESKLSELLNQPEFIASISPLIVASEDFSKSIDDAVTLAMSDDAVLQTIFSYINQSANLAELGESLAGNEGFKSINSTNIITSEAYASDVQERIDEATSNPFKIYSDSLVVDSSNDVTVVFNTVDYPDGVPLPYVILGQHFSGAADSTNWVESSRTSRQVIYNLPSATIGHSLTLTYAISSNA